MVSDLRFGLIACFKYLLGLFIIVVAALLRLVYCRCSLLLMRCFDLVLCCFWVLLLYFSFDVSVYCLLGTRLVWYVTSC